MKVGYLLCLLTAVLFGFTPTVLTLLINSGVSENSAIAYFPFLILLASVCFCAARHISLRVPAKKAVTMLLIGAIGMGVTQALLAAAYLHIPVGTATVLHFLYPTVVTVFSILFFKERGSKKTVLAILCSITGMVLVSIIGNDAAGDVAGYLFALLSSLTYSFYIIGNDGLFDLRNIPYVVSLAYISIGSLIFQVGRAILLDGAIAVPQTGQQWLYAALYAVPMAIAFFLLNIGISKIGAVAASFATLVEPIVSVITSMMIFHNHLTIYSLIGIVLILFSVYLNSAGGKE